MFEHRPRKGPSVTTIRANCPVCGDVQLTPRDLTVRVCAEDESGAYVFQCPRCESSVAKDANQHVVDLLVASGVRLEVWRRPLELLEQHSGPPIDADDLLDFHLLLESDVWFEQVAGMVRRSPTQ
jgi:hypothetical protein